MAAQPKPKGKGKGIPTWALVGVGGLLLLGLVLYMRKRSAGPSAVQPVVQTISGSTPSPQATAFAAQPSQNAAPADSLQPQVLDELHYLDYQVSDLWASIPPRMQRHPSGAIYPFPAPTNGSGPALIGPPERAPH